jgi:hypothetical protein
MFANRIGKPSEALSMLWRKIKEAYVRSILKWLFPQAPMFQVHQSTPSNTGRAIIIEPDYLYYCECADVNENLLCPPGRGNGSLS